MNGSKASDSRAARRRQQQILSRTLFVLLWVAFAPGTGLAQKEGLASACAGCHSKEAASEPLTPMGRALELPGPGSSLASHPKLTFHKGQYSYVVETRGGKSFYTVTDGVHSTTLPIQWSFGEGAQTWVLDRDGEFYESLVSYYPSINGLDVTTGDEGLTPATLEEAIGRKLSKTEVSACFGCHATNAVSDGELNLQTAEPGVRCQHCHTGLESHLISEAMSGVSLESAPPSLSRLNAEEISKFCGQCHRTWEIVVRSGWRGESNVRFQPYRLANSKCFDGTDPRISCLACHDPHQTVVRNEASYDAKCLACHAVLSLEDAPRSRTSAAKTCPVAKSKCVSCHMPRVRLPNGLMTFYDHEIRIVKPGEPYPN